MNNIIQLSSWIISFFVGFVYFFMLNYIIIKINSKKILIKIFLDIIYVIIASLTLMYIYYYFNGGYIHYGYPIFYIAGYFVAKKVNTCVKRLKKTFFLKK